jgi:hypothetical protein
MKKNIIKFVVAILCGYLLLIAGCAPSGSSKEIQITGIGWVYLNADVSFWSDGFSAATCLAFFDIRYSGDDIGIKDISYAKFHRAGDPTSWSFPIDSTHVDASRKIISSYWNYTTDIANNGSAFPIGPLDFEVGLTNGQVNSYTFDVPSPGQLGSFGKEVTYNEDYVGAKPANYAPIVKRASVVSYSKVGGSISIGFTTNDPLFYSGNVTFYDSSGNQVGNTNYMRAYGTGTIASFVNGGLSLYKDGTTNNVSLTASDINFAAGKSYGDIAKFRVFASDGLQYLGTTHTYDCYSAGELKTF